MPKLTKQSIAAGTDRRMTRAERELQFLRPEAKTFAFLSMHRANPHLFLAFLEEARAAARAGREHYSAKQIAENIRWNTGLKTFGRGAGEYKINNNWTSYYARLLVLFDDRLMGLFGMKGHGIPVEASEQARRPRAVGAAAPRRGATSRRRTTGAGARTQLRAKRGNRRRRKSGRRSRHREGRRR